MTKRQREDEEFQAARKRIDARLDAYLGSRWIPEDPHWDREPVEVTDEEGE